MNKKEATQILAMLKAGYPNNYKNITPDEAQGIVSMWCMQFMDMPAEVVLMALNKAISTSKFPPSIADVKEKVTSVHWEAYEEIQRNYISNHLSEGELSAYKRICRETEGYKFANKVEPSIGNLISKQDVKQIGGENK